MTITFSPRKGGGGGYALVRNLPNLAAILIVVAAFCRTIINAAVKPSVNAAFLALLIISLAVPANATHGPTANHDPNTVDGNRITTTGGSGASSGRITSNGGSGRLSGTFETAGGSGEDSGIISTGVSDGDHATSGRIMTNGEMRAGSFTTQTGICGSADNAQCGDFVGDGSDLAGGILVQRTNPDGTLMVDSDGLPVFERESRTHIRAGSIGTADIADDGVGESEIATDAVNSDEIMDGAVQSAEIMDGGVMAADIGDDQVTAAKIADAAIDSADKIMDGVITAAKLDPNIDLGGTPDDDSVSAAAIQSDAVTETKIAADAVTGEKIAANAVQSAEIMDGGVRTADIGDRQITTAKIARGAIGFDHFDPEVQQAFRKIEGDIDRLDEGIAMSMALSGIQMPARKEFGVSVSGGFYQNKQAAAIGIGFRPTDDLLLSAGAAYGFDSEEVGGRVSITFGF